MNTPELELPKYLYTETLSDCGTMKKYIFEPDKLVQWAEEGRGDAITRHCQQVCQKRLQQIDEWESARILQLEDDWISADNDENVFVLDDVDEEVLEAPYHQACEAVTREAEQKRTEVRERMTEHKSAVEQLVQEAREFINAHQPPPQHDNLGVMLFGIGLIILAGYNIFY